MSRTFETTVQLSAAPEAVWRAVATGEGIRTWFAPEARVTPGETGSVWISWGPGMEGESRITAWEPGARLAYTQDRPDREPACIEYTLEGHDGGTRLRLVQSGFGSGGALDEEYDTTSRAWMLFLHLLKHNVEQRYQSAANVTILRMMDRPRAEVWEALGPALRGRVSFDDHTGCRAIVDPDQKRITGIFCETYGGQTAMTLMTVLYDPAAGDEERVRQEWTEVANAISGAKSTAV